MSIKNKINLHKMKILWITNTIFPVPSRLLGIPEPLGGGWMYGLADKVASVEGIQLAIATTYSGDELKVFEVDGLIYYLIPGHATAMYHKPLEFFWSNLCADFKPNIIHIHGTEYAHGLACISACPLLNYVISIQGLVSICARYYYAGLSTFEILVNITFRDIVRFDNLFRAKNKFIQRGEFEKEYIRKTRHVIGRTSWDYAHIKAINASVKYHFCNEMLRDVFYLSPKWNIANKTDYTIFLSQASYPLKGFHQVLKAVALLKDEFPQIKVRVGGQNIINTATLVDKMKISCYGAYIKKLIKKLKLHDHIEFIGSLTEGQMIAEYLNSHLFICPSSIENSSNSLGEAQLLGVPVIASYVGGLPDMVIHGETGLLYRFEEIEMLAENIRNLFVNKTLSLTLSKNGITTAEKRHNQAKNLQQLIQIYQLMRG